MKNLTFLILALLMSLSVSSQTATNFNCNDCASVNHDLFTELNAGKVVVICWVMPCGSCVGGALAAQAACQSFSTSNPGQVYYYCVDDVANTNCTTLSNWCSSNGVTNTTAKFSNSAINMTNYGTAGMPKVVVIGGGTSHTVYYNQNNNTVSQSGVQGAINNALSAITTDVKEIENSDFVSANIYPNPSNLSCSLSFNLVKESKVKIEIQNVLGQKISDAFSGDLKKGENTLTINTSELSNGNYFINISNDGTSKKIKMIVAK